MKDQIHKELAKEASKKNLMGVRKRCNRKYVVLGHYSHIK